MKRNLFVTWLYTIPPALKSRRSLVALNSLPFSIPAGLEPAIFKAIQTKDQYLSPVLIDAYTSEPKVLAAVPIKDLLKTNVGVLIAEINLKILWNVIQDIQVGQEGIAYVVDEKGRLIAFNDIGRVLQQENVSHLPVVNHFLNSEMPRNRFLMTAFTLQAFQENK